MAIITSDVAKYASTLARDARKAWLALAHYSESETLTSDARKSAADNAASVIGRRMLKGTLPREIGGMRSIVETLKQKAEALLNAHNNKASNFASHCEQRTVCKDAATAIRLADQFIAVYKEAKSIAKAA